MDTVKLSIGVNAYEANVSKRVGSNQYAYQLLSHLEKLTRNEPNVRLETAYEIDLVVYLPENPVADMPKERPGFRYVICPPKKLWTQWRLPLELYLQSAKHDVFVSLGHYAPRFCPVPSVVCVLDLAYLKFPQFFLPKDLYQLREWTKYSVKNATHVFTISKASLFDITKQYKKDEKQISIIYPGVEINESTSITPEVAERVLQKFGLKKQKYIVSVGTIQPRKNMITAIHAFESLHEKNLIDPECLLVFVGKAGWMTEEFDTAVAKSTVKEKIIVTGYVEELEKQALLSQAGSSFLVGFYEGFGIPVVESLLHGVRPVVANTSSLPEVSGEFAILVDPYDIASVTNGFAQALAHRPDQMEKARMREWALQFSWETSSIKMLDILIERFGKKQ